MDKKELRKFICEVLDIEKVPLLVEKQIHRFKRELGMEYKQIAQALVYFIEIKKGKYDETYGIGIVPYVFEESEKYIQNQRRLKEERVKSAEQANKQSDIIFKVNKPQRKKKTRKVIDIENLELD